MLAQNRDPAAHVRRGRFPGVLLRRGRRARARSTRTVPRRSRRASARARSRREPRRCRTGSRRRRCPATCSRWSCRSRCCRSASRPFIWYALLIAAVVATVELLRALTGLPRAALAAAVLGTEVVASVTYGQLSPLATLGIAAAALAPAARAVAPRRARLRARAAAAASRARHRSRRCCCGARARASSSQRRRRARLVALAALGFAANAEYARSVVGAQALAEAPFDIQLSLTWLLVFFGSGEPAALHVAWLEYAAMLVAGVLLERRARGRGCGLREDARRRPRGGGGARRRRTCTCFSSPPRCRARWCSPRAFRRRASTRGSPSALLAVPWEATGSRLDPRR